MASEWLCGPWLGLAWDASNGGRPVLYPGGSVDRVKVRAALPVLVADPQRFLQQMWFVQRVGSGAQSNSAVPWGCFFFIIGRRYNEV